MAKPEWGTKRTCHNCGARFYDLRRDEIACPVCHTPHDPERQPRTRRSGSLKPTAGALAPVVVAKKPAPAAVHDDVVEDVGEDSAETGDDDAEKLDDENQDLIEDTSELGEDDDDIGEVIEHFDDDAEDRS